MNEGRIVWLASYPKSGNTWVRSFLTAYRTEADTVDINALDATNAAVRAVLEDLLGLETSELLREEVRNLLPEAYRRWSMDVGQTVFLKTHDCFGRTAKGEHVFPVQATQGVIHVVRDPRDVAVSASHHWGVSLDVAIDRLNASDHWIACKVDSAQIPQFLSDWSTHTAGWMHAPFFSLRLRYEDICLDAMNCFRQILEFVGWKVETSRLERAVKACSFARLQEQEEKSGFRERLAQSTAGFFRQGRVGGWRDVLSEQQAERVVERHRAMMQQLGYLEPGT